MLIQPPRGWRNPAFSSVSYDLFFMHFETRMTWNFNHFMLFSHFSDFISYRITCKVSTAFPPAANHISLLVWYSSAPCSLSISNSDFLSVSSTYLLQGVCICCSFWLYSLFLFFPNSHHLLRKAFPEWSLSPIILSVPPALFKEHFTICDNGFFLKSIFIEI